MDEETIKKTANVLYGRIADMWLAGEISVCQAAERTLLVDKWAHDRRETAGLLVRELEEVGRK
jgi:hypothetical protein